MRSPGERAIEAFHKMWEPWKETGNFPMDNYLSHYSKNFKGFGSGMSEVWRGRRDMQQYSEMMLKNNFKGFSVHTKWIETDEISPGLVCL